MVSSFVDAFDCVAYGEVLEQRLKSASTALANREDAVSEQAWLDAARQQVARAREGTDKLLTRVLRLPELELVRTERGRALQGAVVDALEELHGAINAAGGPRSPLFEVLYSNVKVASMRRSNREDFEKACGDFEKRLGSSYARRMIADEAYASLQPALLHLRSALGDWRWVFASAPLADDEAELLRAELDAAARRLELPTRQARLLAEAALLPFGDLDGSPLRAVLDKPKRRPRPSRDGDAGVAEAAAPSAEGEIGG